MSAAAAEWEKSQLRSQRDCEYIGVGDKKIILTERPRSKEGRHSKLESPVTAENKYFMVIQLEDLTRTIFCKNTAKLNLA